jgi:hypothetical protein
MSYFSIPTDSTKIYAAVTLNKDNKDTKYSLTQLTPTSPMYIQYINLTLKWSAAAYVSQNINIDVSYTKVNFSFSFSYTLFPSQKYTYTVNTTTYTTYNVYLGRNKFPLPNTSLPPYNIGGIYADTYNIPTITIQFTDPPDPPLPLLPPPPSTPTLSIYAYAAENQNQLQNSYFYVKPSDICNLPVPIGGSPSNERRVCYLDTIVNGVLTPEQEADIQNKQVALQEAKKKQILKSKNRAYFSTSILYSRTVLNRSRWCG